MLEVSELHTYYALAHVLRGVSIEAADGRVVALLGRNGAGKSTLVSSIMGLPPAQVRAGSVRYQSTELVGRTPHEVARLGIGLVPQGRRIYRSLTVLEHLKVAARKARNGDRASATWDAERVFSLFPQLAERKDMRGGTLSGGEQQMLAIARALMGNPLLLLMDEPSEGLAPIVLQQLGERVLELKGAGLSIFLVEQNLGLALRLADEVQVLDRGEIVFRGTPAGLESDADVKQRYLGVG
jgi:branched-chain amino acid transport system ATP-binding protein